MTGYRDPFNRGFYPWGEEDTNLQAFYRALARLKRENPALKTGRVEFITASNGRVQFLRQSAGQTAMVFATPRGSLGASSTRASCSSAASCKPIRPRPSRSVKTVSA